MPSLKRLAQIRRTAKRYGLAEFLPVTALPASLRWLAKPLIGSPDHKLSQARGERLRLALETLGPVFIKFGQALSTRRDLLPLDIADELAKLQDQVPPFDNALARNIIEAELGDSVANLFLTFDPEPLASASVAQVHRVTLRTGEAAVIKVIRPHIEATIIEDTRWMAWLAHWITRIHPDGHRLKAQEVVADYTATILDELNLAREAANASQLRRNFEDSDQLYVPKVYWDFTTSRVYTMEEVTGIPVNDRAQLEALNVNFKCLAERGVEIFFTQVLRDSFFHADMHPGNILINASNTELPSYIALDCAIIGSLSAADQYYLARNLLSIFKRDYRTVAQLHVECGWVPPSTRVQDFESAIRTVCEPVFEKPIAELSFGQLLLNLFQTASRFDMPIQPSLVLLQKTLLNIEGLGRELYPQLNLWDTAQPFLENWMQDRYSASNTLQRIKDEAPGLLEQLPSLPNHLIERLLHPLAAEAVRAPVSTSHSSWWLVCSWLLGGLTVATALSGMTATAAGLSGAFLLLTLWKSIT
jgi:ubiquinone biosynthesis protein